MRLPQIVGRLAAGSIELTLTLQDDGTVVATYSIFPGLREVYRRK